MSSELHYVDYCSLRNDERIIRLLCNIIIVWSEVRPDILLSINNNRREYLKFCDDRF